MTDNEELSYIRLDKAYLTLREAENLISGSFWNGAVNRTYYACFYAVNGLLIKAVNGLLIKYGFEPTTHSGVKQLFGLHFIEPEIVDRQFGKFYSSLFNKRMINDYDDFVNFDSTVAIDLFNTAQSFISEIEKLIKTQE